MNNDNKSAYKSVKTPICDFLKTHAELDPVSLHMPGHKGKGDSDIALKYDLTEIDGADSLYFASGIIAESEAVASEIFGCDTYYSAEGSSLCVRAMVRLALQYAAERGAKPLIIAARNAHSSFVSAVALLGAEVIWIGGGKNYLSAEIEPEELDLELKKAGKIAAVFVTSPDYTGKIAPVKDIAKVCKGWGVPLLIDNAHGAYLKFSEPSLHPIDLGADMCCDSAHKTLPALTGSAYLHISPSAPDFFRENAKKALALFGSTSPSYLILRSLDKLNGYLAGGYKEKLAATILRVDGIKTALENHGYTLIGDEPLKIVISPKPFGYTGNQIAKRLEEKNVFAEYYDDNLVIMMITPSNGESDLQKTLDALTAIPRKTPIIDLSADFCLPKRVMSLREAFFSPSELVPIEKALGRIAGEVTPTCPPAVAIVVGGELIDEKTLDALKYYGIKTISVIKTAK
ncbi:MAG: aminotransferase class V-fold PLP-dependent enzyme [Clostridia bacterium]|nr:aminotransferase class V-fold PLP-dependent enzyme [Clostridia bacterium]